MRGWTKSGAFQESLCFVCGYVARKKERKNVYFTLLFSSFSLLFYTFVIYNAEKRKFMSLSLRSADKTYVYSIFGTWIFCILCKLREFSIYVCLWVCVCVCVTNTVLFEFSTFRLLLFCFSFLRILFCFVLFLSIVCF